MTKTLKFGAVIACEHVVMGTGNKSTLINVYSGDIVVSELPVSISMGLYIEHWQTNEQNGKLTLTIMLGTKPIVKIEAKIGENADDPTAVGILAIPHMLIQVPQKTTFKVIASCEGFKDKIIVNKKISQGQLPN